MSKLSFALTSLVAAIPAGILGYLLVTGVVMSGFDKVPLVGQIFVGLTLLCVAVVALTPVLIMLFIGRTRPVVVAPSRKKGAVVDSEDEDELSVAEAGDDDLSVAEESDELSSFDDDLSEDGMEETSAFDSSEFDEEEGSSEVEAASEDFTIYGDDEDEDEPPKKKGKR